MPRFQKKEAAPAPAINDDQTVQTANVKRKSKAKASKGGAAESPPPPPSDPAAASAGNKKKKSTAKRLSWGKRKSGDAAAAGKKGDAEPPVDVHDTLMDAGETDGTQDIPEEYRDAQGNFKMMPVPKHLGSLTRRKPPLVALVGVAGCGKSRLAAALLSRGNQRQHRVELGVGEKTVTPKMVIGEEVSVLDCPGLPDPLPRISDTYYNDTVSKLRSIGYANAIIFVVNQERVTPTLIKNYGLLYRAFNRLDCLKMFVMRIESSFVLLKESDQTMIEKEARRTVNQILAATNLKTWNNQQFFLLTTGSGEEQDKQVKYMREQVKKSPKVDIIPTEGLRLTTEVKTEEVGEAGDGGGNRSPNGGTSSKRNSRKRESSSAASKGDKPAEKSGCSVM